VKRTIFLSPSLTLRLFLFANTVFPLTLRCVLSLCNVRQSARRRRKSRSVLLASHFHSAARCHRSFAVGCRVLDDESRSTPINSDQPRCAPLTFLVAFASNCAIWRTFAMCAMFDVYVSENKKMLFYSSMNSRLNSMHLCKLCIELLSLSLSLSLWGDQPTNRRRRSKVSPSLKLCPHWSNEKPFVIAVAECFRYMSIYILSTLKRHNHRNISGFVSPPICSFISIN